MTNINTSPLIGCLEQVADLRIETLCCGVIGAPDYSQ